MSSVPAESPVTVRRIPSPEEPVPVVAVPTLVLLVVSMAVWIASTTLYATGDLAWWATIPINAVAGYLLFTVAHDAGHHSASRVKWLNDLMGRVSTPFFALHAAFPVWRFIHMQHHRFTNHDDGADPDHYTMEGPAWQRPLRWLTIDYAYIGFYLPKLGSRRPKERVEAIAFIVLGIAVPVALIATGNVVAWLVILFIPSRLAIMWLAYAFDYLPHNGLHHKPTEDRMKTTRNRIGGERWVSPLMLYQNYHLVHHLHPIVPFYRYIAVWRRNEPRYLDGDPALSTLRGREITPDEYRRMRDLVEHHH
ncbi:fatty acid desaturase [Patulibacter brassicae]|jgi:ring-1,2-phenylacetyl-CoA epoxidase subunit PaaE|uniref:Fatty acid desaturase n=1 Tax=Patulibacter brassicae TaxID=1705717 RepID=A0ABU4VPC1_9ACTN|nr:fatty acid desaturase [Patulibacter brassicae]MDX8153711.1 fatty acid desaturase [Patulibacter brassicae]